MWRALRLAYHFLLNASDINTLSHSWLTQLKRLTQINTKSVVIEVCSQENLASFEIGKFWNYIKTHIQRQVTN